MVQKKFYHFLLILGVCLTVAISAGCAKDNPGEASSLADSHIAYIGADGLYASNMEGENAQQLVAGNNLSFPLFSGNGTALAYLADKDLYAYDFNTDKTVLLLAGANSYCAGASSSFYASSPTEGLLLIEDMGTKKTVLLTTSGATEDQSQASKSTFPSFDIEEGSYLEYNNLTPSPDFSRLAFNIYIRNGDMAYSGGTWVMDTATGEFSLAVEGKKSTESEIGTDPQPSKFSPDGKTLFVWLRPASASISADGVPYGLYDLATKKLTPSSSLDESTPSQALAYNENVSFSQVGSFALLAGTSRMMYETKYLQIINYTASSLDAKGIPTENLIPAMPNLSKDGQKLYFAAFTGQDPLASSVPAYEYPLQRQLYAYSREEIKALTNDTTYRCEAPHLLNDNTHLFFGRINNETNEMSLWLINTEGSEAKQLASWPMPDEASMLYNDYYGRGNWDGMIAYYDAT